MHAHTSRHAHAPATRLHRLKAQQPQQQHPPPSAGEGRSAPLLLLWLLSLQPMQPRRRCVHVLASAGERLRAQPPKLAKGRCCDPGRRRAQGRESGYGSFFVPPRGGSQTQEIAR